jgi:transcriptional regulator with XRE-family HTH domain
VPDDTPALPPRSRLFAADTIDLRVAARLSARRGVLGLDASLLDTILHFREGTVARFEACASRIGASQLYRLAHVLDVDIDWLFADDAAIDQSDAELHPLAGDKDGKEAVQARRFLSLVAQLDRGVQLEIGAIVKAIANSTRRDEPAATPRPEPAAPRRSAKKAQLPPPSG